MLFIVLFPLHEVTHPVMPPIWLCQSAGIAPWGVTPKAARGEL
ncbi:hypothetical protein [Hydrogenophaga sp. Root209]|nr:hypothetical protein [Hydrogenophaga sp. Root209]